MGFTKYRFTYTHVIIRNLNHLINKINYIIRIINHIFRSEYHRGKKKKKKKFNIYCDGFMQLVRRFLFPRLYIIIILRRFCRLKSVEAVKKTASIAVCTASEKTASTNRVFCSELVPPIIFLLYS
jgi:L-cystine uptake protein TcyP (sodium:dicarboxylate symporter family)